jgi:glycosyltransferase involved in cell wall biosynthesis
MKLACTTVYDPLSPSSYAGARVYHQLQALNREIQQIYHIGPLSHSRLAPLLLAKRSFYRYVENLSYHPKRDRLMVRDYARQIARRLAEVDADIIFSPLSPCSQPVAYLDAKQPIVIWTDTTWASVVDFYPDFKSSEICAETLRDALTNERSALFRAGLVIYWSDWAAQSALRHYKLDPARVRVVSPGPPVEHSLSPEDAACAIRARPKDRCRLVFVGEQWERKGGELAVEIAKTLNASGLPTDLTLIGCRPPEPDNLPPFVTSLGHISRGTANGAARWRKLMAEAHFLVVPSRAEAFGLVYGEASSFAVPSLATAVGGVQSAVRSGVNGMTFSVSAPACEYAAFIDTMFARYSQYEELARSSYMEFSTRLNNRAAAKSLRRIMEEVI